MFNWEPHRSKPGIPLIWSTQLWIFILDSAKAIHHLLGLRPIINWIYINSPSIFLQIICMCDIFHSVIETVCPRLITETQTAICSTRAKWGAASFGRFPSCFAGFPSCRRSRENLPSQQIPSGQISRDGREILSYRYAFHEEEAPVLSAITDFCFSRSSPGGGLRIGRPGKVAMFPLLPKGSCTISPFLFLISSFWF